MLLYEYIVNCYRVFHHLHLYNKLDVKRTNNRFPQTKQNKTCYTYMAKLKTKRKLRVSVHLREYWRYKVDLLALKS